MESANIGRATEDILALAPRQFLADADATLACARGGRPEPRVFDKIRLKLGADSTRRT